MFIYTLLFFIVTLIGSHGQPDVLFNNVWKGRAITIPILNSMCCPSNQPCCSNSFTTWPDKWFFCSAPNCSLWFGDFDQSCLVSEVYFTQGTSCFTLSNGEDITVGLAIGSITNNTFVMEHDDRYPTGCYHYEIQGDSLIVSHNRLNSRTNIFACDLEQLPICDYITNNGNTYAYNNLIFEFTRDPYSLPYCGSCSNSTVLVNGACFDAESSIRDIMDGTQQYDKQIEIDDHGTLELDTNQIGMIKSTTLCPSNKRQIIEGLILKFAIAVIFFIPIYYYVIKPAWLQFKQINNNEQKDVSFKTDINELYISIPCAQTAKRNLEHISYSLQYIPNHVILGLNISNQLYVAVIYMNITQNGNETLDLNNSTLIANITIEYVHNQTTISTTDNTATNTQILTTNILTQPTSDLVSNSYHHTIDVTVTIVISYLLMFFCVTD